ncbi:MAG: hypothetical protein M0Z94_13585 [Dehalococcoidales bacterium]|nr:hypothetical protein [Dehalococcoidales bacterium]
MKVSAYLPFVALLAVAVPVEVGAGLLAYHTIGEVTSAMLVLAVALNVVPVLLYVAGRQSLAVGLVLLLVVALVFPQVVLGQRLISLQQEAASIVAYTYETRLATGEYPADLSGYAFHDPSLSQFVEGYARDEERGGFALFYYVGSPATSHSYSPRHGWQYYPD